jgi:trehalose-6-phosphate synthase
MSIPVLNWSGRGLYYPQTSQRSVACWETLLTRLIIVSNRVGLPEDGTRAGGLEVAIRPALKRRGGIWFGWSGQISDDAPGPPKISQHEKICYVTLPAQETQSVCDPQSEHFKRLFSLASGKLRPLVQTREDL